MRKFFILTLMVASLMMVSCVERRNQVILEHFIPISESSGCEVKLGGDSYLTEGTMDLAFTKDYLLAFQIYNYIPSSEGGTTDLTTAEANYFYTKYAEIEYELDTTGSRQLPEGSKNLEGEGLLEENWKKKRQELHGIVVKPGEGAAGVIHVFEEEQIKDLLKIVEKDFDWIGSPIVIKVKIHGSLSDGTKVQTNKMFFSIRPTLGGTIQAGSVYPEPDGGLQDETDENGKVTKSADKFKYEAQIDYCSFEQPIIGGGCFPGQDSARVNCYAGGDAGWQRYIAETYCSGSDCDVDPAFTGAGSVILALYKYYNAGKEYRCCPQTKPEAPEEKEEEEENSAE